MCPLLDRRPRAVNRSAFFRVLTYSAAKTAHLPIRRGCVHSPRRRRFAELTCNRDPASDYPRVVAHRSPMYRFRTAPMVPASMRFIHLLPGAGNGSIRSAFTRATGDPWRECLLRQKPTNREMKRAGRKPAAAKIGCPTRGRTHKARGCVRHEISNLFVDILHNTK